MSLLTVKQVAERLNVSLSKAYELLPKIGFFKIDGSSRVSSEQLSTYLESCRRGRGAATFAAGSDPRPRPRLRRVRL